MANKLFVKKNFTVYKEYQNVASKTFYADCENIDFVNTKEAAETMNKWTEKHTNNKIHDLISSDDLDDDTRLVLINALHFKDEWSKPFTTRLTYNEEFYISDTETKKIETMHSQLGQHYKYLDCHHLKAQFLELELKNNASMTFALPNEINGLETLEKEIHQVLNPCNYTWELVDISLPKFKIESSFKFKTYLKNLGVKKAFDKHEADLSGIAGNKGDLIIDMVNQKTFMDVGEGGVEAAAATFDLIPIPPSAQPEPKLFKVNHPFIFYIKVKDVVIFVGRFVTPN